MERVETAGGITVSYEAYGSGPPLVLVHGGFSDHITNWQRVKSLLQDQFSVYAIARRGRGETSATYGHSVADEAADIAAVVQQIGEPVFLLGHSYGAVCSLAATAMNPEGVSKLILYEPPYPNALPPELVAELRSLGERKEWDRLVQKFMLYGILVPQEEVDALRATPDWDTWTIDAEASLNDLQSLVSYHFDAEGFRSLSMPVQLLIGSESPRDVYVTDALASVLPHARIDELAGQAHEGMTTAPELFVDVISRFLLE